MILYPQQIINAYAKQQISKTEFKNRRIEWQKMSGLDYSLKGIEYQIEAPADKSGSFFDRILNFFKK